MKKHGKICMLLTLIVILLLPVQVFGGSKTVPEQVKITSVYSDLSDRAVIKWKSVKDVTKYRIYYKPYGEKKWVKVGDVSGNKTSYTHTRNSLKPGKKYTYTVRGYNNDSKKWGKYDAKGKTVTISTTIRNKKYNYYTRLFKQKGGPKKSASGQIYYDTGVTKVNVGKNNLTLEASFIRGTDLNYNPPIKKNFLKHQMWSFKTTPQTTYYMGDEKVSRIRAMDCVKRLNGLGLTMIVKNNTIIKMRFNS